jgi:hypothetical protein
MNIVNINNDTDTVLKLTKHLILCIDKLKILRYGINVHETTIQQNSKIQNLIHRERRAVSNKGTMSTTLKMFSQLQNSIRVVINVNGIYHAHFRHFERTTPFRIVSHIDKRK